MSSTLLHDFSRLARVIFGLAMMSCCYSAWAQQIENPIACDEANEPLEVVYGAHTTGCGISPATDLDQFSFFGFSGDIVRITILSGSLRFDPRLEIRDPDGVLIEDASCAGGSNVFNETRCFFTVEPPDFSIVPSPTLTKTGIYFLALSDLNNNEAGSYTAQIERITPESSPPDIRYNVAETDLISPATDMDFFSFHGVQGTSIRITVLSTSLRYDPRLEIWDPDGLLIEDTFCAGGSNVFNESRCSFSVEPADFSVVPSPTLTKTGTYIVALSDLNTNEIGGYDINLQCLFGPCPAAADLVLTMADSADPVNAGSPLDYSLVATNNGPGDAQAVVVTTMLPTEVTFDATTGCNEDPNGVPDCNLGEIANGESVQFDIAVTVDAAFQGTITNVAAVDALTSEGSAGDETATEDTQVLSGDLIFQDGFEQ